MLSNNVLHKQKGGNLLSGHQCSGCRADANEAAVILLPSNITVFTLDFSGSGLSDGDYVSLGWHEVHPLFTNFLCDSSSSVFYIFCISMTER